MFKKIAAYSVITAMLFAGAFQYVQIARAQNPNLVANPSVETPSSISTIPQGWQTGNWGTNSATFSYLSTGEDGSRSLQVSLANYSSGDAKWFFNPVTITPSASYDFTDYYQSNVTSYLVAEEIDSIGNITYVNLKALPASSTWTQSAATLITLPTTASLTIFHLISSAGVLTTDNYSFALSPPVLPNPPPSPGTNLIANPSFETQSMPNIPDNWTTSSWGSNTSSFTYANYGHTGSRSGSVVISKYVSGDAKWVFSPVTAVPGSTYVFSDYYESTISSGVVAAFVDTSGVTSYQDLGSVAASPSYWSQVVDNFVAPANAATVTVYHLINSVGSLSTDDYALSQQFSPVVPSVVINSPSNGATLSGITSLGAVANDAAGVSNVAFYLNGSQIGSPVSTSPYLLSWDTQTVANGSYTLTAISTNSLGVKSVSAPITINVNNPIPFGANLITNPLVSTVSPTNNLLPLGWTTSSWGTNSPTYKYATSGFNDTRSLKVTLSSFTSGDAKWMFTPVNIISGNSYTYSDYYQSGVSTDVVAMFSDPSGNITYADLGAAPASTTWKNYTGNFTAPLNVKTVSILHILAQTGSLTTDDFNLMQSVTVNLPNSNAPLTGLVSFSVNSSGIPIGSTVKYLVDSLAVGASSVAPFSYSWDSSTVTNGTHNLSAMVTDPSGNSLTTHGVAIMVSNPNPVSGNLIPNPNLLSVSSTSATQPLDWTSSTWGTNTTKFSYLTTGYNGAKSVKVQITKYTSGDSKWYFTAQNVTKDTQYKFSDYYQSTTPTEVDAVFTMSDGSTIYQIIGLPGVSGSWQQFQTTFALPLGTVNVTIFHLIHSVGTLTTSDFSLAPYIPVGFSRPLLTLTFDDGYDNMFTQALPLLQNYGFNSTQFIITSDINTTGYMTTAQVQAMSKAGTEMASHTVTHNDLTQETSAQVLTELAQSQSVLAAWIGLPVTDLAYPLGLYTSSIEGQVKTYYTAARGVEDGLNSKDNFNIYDIKAQNVYDTTTTAQISDWVAQAQATNTWLVLVYHSVDPNTASPIDGGIYNITPSQLDSQLAAIKTSGIQVETMQQAIQEIAPQL
ncbi:MAG: polysaccharide deacetylase family protein [Candidatus Saccharimonadia bacterium]